MPLYDGRWDSGWYDLPSAADVAPTVLGYLGALPAADKNDLAGSTPVGRRFGASHIGAHVHG